MDARLAVRLGHYNREAWLALLNAIIRFDEGVWSREVRLPSTMFCIFGSCSASPYH